MVTINPNQVDLNLHCPIGWSNSQTHILHIKLHLHLPTVQLLSYHVIQIDMICIMISYSITVLSLYAYPNKCTKHDHDVHHV